MLGRSNTRPRNSSLPEGFDRSGVNARMKFKANGTTNNPLTEDPHQRESSAVQRLPLLSVVLGRQGGRLVFVA